MALGEFYNVPDVNLKTATHAVFGSCIDGINRSMDKTAWAGERLEDLARRLPEELPPCFLAVKAEGLSCYSGWKTEHGKWVPRDASVDGSRPFPLATVPLNSDGTWLRTTLMFIIDDGSKDGRKTNFAMTIYNVLHRHGSGSGALLELEEDMALCHVFRVAKRKRKVVVPSPPQSGVASNPFNLSQDELNKIILEPIPTNFLEFDFPDLGDSGDLGEYNQGNDMGGYEMRSIDPPGGPKKQPKSDAWDNFIKICTKDPRVTYGACHHCPRAMKLKDGSTSSLLNHMKSCASKSRSPMGTHSLH